jgi:membrane protein DedA with SNARE-associated domain
MIVCGRYVPGMRFVVSATYGLSDFPSGRFLLWAAIGGTLWSVYTCVLAEAVATRLANFPLASIFISGFITTLVVAGLFLLARRRRRHAVMTS